jgi:hypothetical protein
VTGRFSVGRVVVVGAIVVDVVVVDGVVDVVVVDVVVVEVDGDVVVEDPLVDDEQPARAIAPTNPSANSLLSGTAHPPGRRLWSVLGPCQAAGDP